MKSNASAAFDLVQRDAMHGGDLRRIGRDRGAFGRPHHDRRNQIAGPGRIIVEQTQHVHRLPAQGRVLREARAAPPRPASRPRRSVRPAAPIGRGGRAGRRRAGSTATPCRRHRASTSAMATAARFSAGGGSLAGSRANSAQRPAIFRLVVSSNGQIIPLDYNTSAIDEMITGKPECLALDGKTRYDRQGRGETQSLRLDHR